MRVDKSYLFKPDAKRFDISLLMTFLLVAIGIYLFFFMKKGLGSIFGESESQQKEGGDPVVKEVPSGIDQDKLNDRLNRLSNLMNTLGSVDQDGMIKICSDLTGKELDWIYIKFGNRVYQHGFLDLKGKQDLKLFGWFDRRLNEKNAKKMAEIWLKSSFDYVPINPKSE